MFPKNKGSKKQKVILLSASGILVCLGLLIGGYQMYKTYEIDKDAKDGNLQLESLQEKANKENFHFQISVDPRFESGEAEGELMIVNPTDNDYKMSVDIKLNDSEELIYQSDILAPDQRIRYAKLSKALAKGEYPAVAVFHILDKATEEEVGQVEAQINITILN